MLSPARLAFLTLPFATAVSTAIFYLRPILVSLVLKIVNFAVIRLPVNAKRSITFRMINAFYALKLFSAATLVIVATSADCAISRAIGNLFKVSASAWRDTIKMETTARAAQPFAYVVSQEMYVIHVTLQPIEYLTPKEYAYAIRVIP